MSNEFGKPGTVEFAEQVSTHFIELTNTLKDIMGQEAFSDYCSFAVGIEFLHPDENGLFHNNIMVRASGSLTVAMRLIADLIDLTAMNIVKQKGIPHEQAINDVLAMVKHEMLATKRLPIE